MHRLLYIYIENQVCIFCVRFGVKKCTLLLGPERQTFGLVSSSLATAYVLGPQKSCLTKRVFLMANNICFLLRNWKEI